MSVGISVVIPTYRRADFLERCLCAVCDQDYDSNAFEIIVADDACEDNVRLLVERLAERFNRKIHYVPVHATQGPAGARNAGAKRASFRVLAFTDDDCVPSREWLLMAGRAFESGAEAAWGLIRMPLPPVPTDYELNEAGLERAVFVTANCFCSRALFQSLGGFDENFTVAWREDSDLYFRIQSSGARIDHVPQAVVIHPVRPAPWAVHLKLQRKSMFDALLYKKHPGRYRGHVRPFRPWHYYFIVGSALGALCSLIAQQPVLTAAFSAAWLVMTARFCLQRLARTSRSFTHVSEMIVTSIAIPFLSVGWRIYGGVRFRVIFF